MKNISKSKLIQLTSNCDKLSLYVHIPFCNTKCDYCAFYSESKVNWDKDNIVAKYLNKIIKEINLIKSSLKNSTFETVFIGGGNPGSLSVEQLRLLLINIGPSSETTFEINPESFIKDYDGYKQLFVEGLANRLSMGIQSMDDSILNILNRNATKDDNLKALNYAKQLASIKSNKKNNYFLKNNLCNINQINDINSIEISFDLMTCLPTQTLDMAKHDIDTIINIANPNHISLYCLTVEEGTSLKERIGLGDVKVMSDDEQIDHLNSLWNYLKQKGFEHYEISNFAKHGKQCIHNNRYWTLQNYIGLGSHAASTIFDEKNRLVRIYNDSNFHKFIGSDYFIDYNEEIIDKNIERDEYLLVALRTRKGVNKQVLLEQYKISNEELKIALKSINNSLFEENDISFSLNEKGFMILDSIILTLSLAFDKFLT